MADQLSIFVCGANLPPGCGLEEMWFAQLNDQGEREQEEWEREEDRDQEELLAREFVEDMEDGLDPELPFYADLPYEVEEPEIIEHAELGDQYGLGLHCDDAAREPDREDEPQAWHELQAQPCY